MGLSGEMIRNLFNKRRESSFEVYKDKKGEFRFRLRSSNGKIIAVGEGYKEKRDCLHAVILIKKNSPYAKIKDFTFNDWYIIKRFLNG